MPTSRYRPASTTAIVVLAALCLTAPAVYAQRYPVTRYTTAAGLPSARVAAIAQDARGFLWFGTGGGLARYDGSTIEVVLAARAAADGIVALLPIADGGMWVATGDGLLGTWRDGVFNPVADAGATGGRILSLDRDASGTIWVGTARGALRIDPGDAPVEIEVSGCCRALLRDRRGRVWAGTTEGLRQIRDDRLLDTASGVPSGVGVNVLLEDPAGSVWAGTDRGLFREVAGRFRRADLPLGDEVAVLSGTLAPGGTLWFGTERGALRIAGGVDRVLTARNGLPDDRVNDIMIDAEGTVWLATDGGIGKLVGSSFATFTAAQGLAGDYVVAVEIDRAGRVWAAGRSGVAVVEDGAARAIPLESLGQATVTALDLTPTGTLLVGTSRGVILRRGERERHAGPPEGLTAPVTAVAARGERIWVGTTDGLYVGDGADFAPASDFRPPRAAHVTALEVDPAGRLWIGTRDQGLWVDGPEGTAQVGGAELAGTAIWDLEAGRDGNVWVATNGGGVVGVRAEPPFEPARDVDGIASDFVQQITLDRSGRLWVYSSQGLDRWDPQFGPVHFGLASGLADLAASPGAAATGPDGRLWFGTPSGLTVFVPGAEPGPEATPRVVVREVRVDGTPIVGDEVELDPDAQEVTIAFAALSYRDESATRFRYRLLGQSDRWIWLDDQRRVTFGQLPAGSYTFEVSAISAGGEWSAEPATVAIRVRPAFWETAWFLGGIGAIVLGLLLTAFRFRLRRVEDDRQRLRLMVDRRTRELVEKNSLLERMATTDELTGLPNRRFFLDSMERELRKLSRTPSPQPLSLLVLDIDHFKSINDRHGHAAGDEVLRRLGRRLSQGVRATDLPARYGGEEFAILLPATDPDGARFLAEKLRSEVESMDVRYEGRRIPVTISIGLASVEGTVRYEREVEEDLLRRADEAMYRAKSGGRNRVVSDGDTEERAEA